MSTAKLLKLLTGFYKPIVKILFSINNNLYLIRFLHLLDHCKMTLLELRTLRWKYP